MRALAIDTVTEMCSVALWLEGEIIERQQLSPNQHSNIVLGMVDAVLAEAGVSLSQLDLIINDVGPGSFTGIRIGLGVAQGLAYGANLPVLGVDALSTLAYGAKGVSDAAILAAIDARMGQVYWGLFEQTEESITLQGELGLCGPQAIAGVSQNIIGVGSGWDAYVAVLTPQLRPTKVIEERFPLAINGLRMGLELPKGKWLTASALTPLYLRNDVARVSTKPLPSQRLLKQ